MPCSAVTLSLATISSIVAVALLAIAFSTDNWLSYEVKRNNIQVIETRKPIADVKCVYNINSGVALIMATETNSSNNKTITNSDCTLTTSVPLTQIPPCDLGSRR